MSLTKEQMQAVVDQWKNAADELRKIKDDELSQLKYDWKIVDALLEMVQEQEKTQKRADLLKCSDSFPFFKKDGNPNQP
jgi:hypothetical protein